MALGTREDADLQVLPAPAALPECITWAVIPRGRVLRDYALALLHGLAPQLDRRDLRRVLEGNQAPDWPVPPRWVELSTPNTVSARLRCFGRTVRSLQSVRWFGLHGERLTAGLLRRARWG